MFSSGGTSGQAVGPVGGEEDTRTSRFRRPLEEGKGAEEEMSFRLTNTRAWELHN